MTSLAHLSDDELLQHLRRAAQALPDAPQAWQERAMSLMAAPTLASTLAAAARLVVAVLSFDSWATPAPALGMRSGAGATRHLLFTADDRDVDLRIASQGGQFGLSGQVLGPDEAGTVELARLDGEPGAAVSAVLDEMGSFRVDGLSSGDWRMVLRVGDLVIELPTLELDERLD